MECSESGQNYTYNELLEKMPKWAGFLTTLGLEKGDVIAICMPNCPEYPIALLGAVSSGLIVTTLNPKNTEDEITKQLRFSGAKVLVVTASVTEVVPVMKANPSVQIVVNGPCSIPSTFNFQQILSDPLGTRSYPIELTEREISVLPFSSGTTGPPKGVQVSHGAISINIRMISHPSVMATSFATDNFQEIYMSLLPFYHMFGMLIMMIGLHQGAKLVTFPIFQPSLYVNTLRKHRVETLHLVPPLVNFLIQSPDVTAETLSQLRTIIISAAPFSLSVAQAFKKKFSKDVFLQEMFGMTEVLLAMANPLEGERIGSCGKLLSNVTAKVIDTSTGSPLGINETGELCYKTPSMMTGYYRNEAATSSTIDSEGFLRSGDVGFIDSEGYVRIVDRTKELIKVKGLQVSPSEIENVLRKHPRVVDVGVVGVPHERYGEVPKAFVVASNEELSSQDIHSFLSTRVAPYKHLVGGVSFVKELPRTPTGKLLRRKLKLIEDEVESR
ncbi:probable 4-coumarate--CoA ligase 1 isoform X2 [Palaemon carinicauda]|uniref:probable 4-coumarate--CoA ligase 1 isoform X2 n=1 Tax=Palaemon carinicauda TaxID=392227 RepID=UPI0035B65336